MIKFHDDFTIAPIEAGVLAKDFLGILRKQLHACPASAEQIKAAAKLLTAVPADKAVYVMVESHLLAGEAYLPVELPNWLLVQRGWRWQRAAPTLDKGDGIAWLGYLDWPNKEVQKAIQQQNPFAAVSVRGPDVDTTKRDGLVWVPAPWVYPDAVVEIKNYPMKACPTSGIVQGTLLWGLMGEVMQGKQPESGSRMAGNGSQEDQPGHG